MYAFLILFSSIFCLQCNLCVLVGLGMQLCKEKSIKVCVLTFRFMLFNVKTFYSTATLFKSAVFSIKLKCGQLEKNIFMCMVGHPILIPYINRHLE